MDQEQEMLTSMIRNSLINLLGIPDENQSIIHRHGNDSNKTIAIRHAAKYIDNLTDFTMIMKHYNLKWDSLVEGIGVLDHLVIHQNKNVLLEFYHSTSDKKKFIEYFYSSISFVEYEPVVNLTSHFCDWNEKDYYSFLLTIYSEKEYMNLFILEKIYHAAFSSYNLIAIEILSTLYEQKHLFDFFNSYRISKGRELKMSPELYGFSEKLIELFKRIKTNQKNEN